jgi:hypothetical protein
MILWATFRAFGAAPPLAIVWIAYLIGELGGLIPVPGGIGGVDAGLVGTLALYNVSLAPATAAVLAYRAIALWVPAVLGAFAFVALRRTLREEANEIAVCAPQTEMEVIGVGRVVIRSATMTSRELGVLPTEVVNAADGWPVANPAVWSARVVVLEPVWQGLVAVAV